MEIVFFNFGCPRIGVWNPWQIKARPTESMMDIGSTSQMERWQQLTLGAYILAPEQSPKFIATLESRHARVFHAPSFVVFAHSGAWLHFAALNAAGKSTLRRDIRIIRQGQCREVKEGDKTTLRDSHVNFHGVNGSTLLEVHFSPTWYSITEGEPIRKDCVYSEDKIKRVKILAGPPRVG